MASAIDDPRRDGARISPAGRPAADPRTLEDQREQRDGARFLETRTTVSGITSA